MAIYQIYKMRGFCEARIEKRGLQKCGDLQRLRDYIVEDMGPEDMGPGITILSIFKKLGIICRTARAIRCWRVAPPYRDTA